MFHKKRQNTAICFFIKKLNNGVFLFLVDAIVIYISGVLGIVTIQIWHLNSAIAVSLLFLNDLDFRNQSVAGLHKRQVDFFHLSLLATLV